MELKEFKNLISDYGKKIDIVFNEKQIKQFYSYMNLLLEWNENINLTAITNPEDIILKHFIDSLTVNKYIKENKTLADVGTGAGFPGIPLKIYRPDLNITLVDSLNKRIKFLDEVIMQLDLKNINTVHSRVEDFGKDKKYREKYDYVTARAVANLSVLSEYLIPIAKVNGNCICMKGNDIKEELDNSKNAINILGGKISTVDEFKLADSEMNRNIIVINKIKSTPNKYPRKAGIPSKEPLQ
jgi:16S rRNA (guanine527-N7)-methyltransferase